MGVVAIDIATLTGAKLHQRAVQIAKESFGTLFFGSPAAPVDAFSRSKARLSPVLKSEVVSPPTSAFMITEKIEGVSVTTQANVYFDGKCVSHGITFPDGTKKSVGVVLPATLTFNTGAPEVMECVAGSCEYKLSGADQWATSSAGEKFSVPGNATFDIRVAEAYHYICHYG